ncbi:MAG: pyridoxamine kinase [Clostridia bacterium]|nr:pyridoxamine kinase [Clostridia bacterium]
MRVLAINDISCIGKCSLTATLPILSACGIECTVLPTAILSTHTGGFTGYTFRDCTEDIPAILRHWKTLDVQFDYICSGYLGSIEQIEMVANIKNEFLADGGKFIVDPVMGDSGKLYAGFTDGYVEKMRSLCRIADYILPNVTEACYLAALPYPLKKANAEKAVRTLQGLCPRPIVTGIVDDEGVTVAFADETGDVCTYAHENVEGFFCGAGDVFASAFVGCLARGKSEGAAIRLASDFATACIRRSAKEVPDKRFGLPFEKEIFSFLQKVNG